MVKTRGKLFVAKSHFFIVSLIILGLSIPDRCEGAAITFTSSLTSVDTELSLGWQFSVLEDITVINLGYFDAGLNGFATPHEVGIFDSLGNLITSTLLSAGTAHPLVDQFRYAPISPVVLLQDQTYMIAATSFGPWDPWAYGEAGSTLEGLSVGSSISILLPGAYYDYQVDNALRFPTSQCCGYTLYGGPNFVYTSEAIPEPNLAILMALGLFTLLATRRMARDTHT